MRIERQPAFVLHARAWRETSLLLEVFTREHGRIGVIAQGVRGPRKQALRAALQPFVPISVDLLHRSELARLIAAEPSGLKMVRARVQEALAVVVAQPYEFVPPTYGDFWPALLRPFLLPHLLKRDGVARVECRHVDRLRASLALSVLSTLPAFCARAMRVPSLAAAVRSATC